MRVQDQGARVTALSFVSVRLTLLQRHSVATERVRARAWTELPRATGKPARHHTRTGAHECFRTGHHVVSLNRSWGVWRPDQGRGPAGGGHWEATQLELQDT